MESDWIKRLSVLLFTEVKPVCVRISELSVVPDSDFDPNSSELILSVSSLNSILQQHKLKNTQDGQLYYLNPNLADYVFFPISNLLKQNQLSDQIVEGILEIIDFLVLYCWIPNGKFTTQLAEQLYPVCCYLVKGNSNDIETLLSLKSIEFKAASVASLSSITRNLEVGFFLTGDLKRLSLLGDTSSIFLAILKSLDPRADSDLIGTTLSSMKSLFLRTISAEQLSHIFPGVISTLTNFLVSSKNLHSQYIAETIDLVKGVIVRVFNDRALGVDVTASTVSNELLRKQLEQNTEVDAFESITANVTIPTNGNHINSAWLKATSKKLKISLSAMFKALFERNKSKVTKQPVVDSIQMFVKDIYEFCFWSLFNEIFAFSIDTLALLCYSRCYPDIGVESPEVQSQILEDTISFIRAYIPDSETVVKLLVLKLDDMVEHKIAAVFTSTSEERILKFLCSIKLHLLLLRKLDQQELDLVIQKILLQLKNTLSETVVFNGTSTKTNKNDFLDSYTGKDVLEEDNRLDNIQLPPYIRASNLKKVRNQPTRSEVFSDLILISKDWSLSTTDEPIRYFQESLTASTETELGNFVSFLNTFGCSLLFLEDLLISENTSTADKGVALWLANKYVKLERLFDIAEFVDFGDGEDVEDEKEEMAYLLASQSQELIEGLSDHLQNLTVVSSSRSEVVQNQVVSKSYAMAIDSIGVLSSCLPKDEFREHFLIDYLFPLFEALTFNSNPVIQLHSQTTVSLIAKNYYNGSLADLIMDNLNYLVDALSLKLSIPGSLTPAIPGILLIVLKISGLKLLLSNQLNDVISQIFILIDSYHGYSILVEGFFVLFNELVKQVKDEYLGNKSIEKPSSLYKPWGMTSIEQVRNLVNESGKIVDAFTDYDPEKEYFRKKDAPFSEMDSDDESAGEEDHEDITEPESKWESIVPKDVYLIVQKIFIYGLRLLSHPSDALKISILKTLFDIYPILSMNYPLVLPVVADNWNEVLGLFPKSGDFSDEVAIRAFEFITLVIETDRAQNDTFFSKRFLDLCNDILSRFKASRDGNELVKIDKFKRENNIRLVRGLAKYLLTGLNSYERIVPDVLALQLMRIIVGVEKENFGPKASNIAWVLKTNHL